MIDDELVARLRHAAGGNEAAYVALAADAIESLQAECDRLRGILVTKTNECSRLRDELAAAQKDAERYHFMRRFDHFAYVDALLDTTDYNTLDSAVDAAMKGDSDDQ